MDINILLGTQHKHLHAFSNGQRIHEDMLNAFQELQLAASVSGHDLTIASGFRDFERQQKIWNGKFLGLLPVYDTENNLVDMDVLSELDKVHAIMRFSALPGGSRHHWGTDFDYYDKSKVAKDYQLKLISDEYTDFGPFTKLREWLELNAKDYGFYFPYAEDLGGVSPEPWHLSFAPLSESYFQTLETQPKLLFDYLLSTDIAGKETVIKHFELLLDRYILNINRIE